MAADISPLLSVNLDVNNAAAGVQAKKKPSVIKRKKGKKGKGEEVQQLERIVDIPPVTIAVEDTSTWDRDIRNIEANGNPSSQCLLKPCPSQEIMDRLRMWAALPKEIAHPMVLFQAFDSLKSAAFNLVFVSLASLESLFNPVFRLYRPLKHLRQTNPRRNWQPSIGA